MFHINVKFYHYFFWCSLFENSGKWWWHVQYLISLCRSITHYKSIWLAFEIPSSYHVRLYNTSKSSNWNEKVPTMNVWESFWFIYKTKKKVICLGFFTLACGDAELREIRKVQTNILGLRKTAAPSYFIPSCCCFIINET